MSSQILTGTSEANECSVIILFSHASNISLYVYFSVITYWTPRSTLCYPCAKTSTSWTLSMALCRVWCIMKSPLLSTNLHTYKVWHFLSFGPLEMKLLMLCEMMWICLYFHLFSNDVYCHFTGFGFNGLWRFAGPFSKVWMFTFFLWCLYFLWSILTGIQLCNTCAAKLV